MTSATRPEDYEAIAVPELWIYRQSQLGIYVFDEQRYQRSDRSPLFPDWPLRDWIPQYVERAWVAGSSVALREFEACLQS